MLQAFNCEACGSLRPSSNSAALQEDEPSSSSHQGDGDAKQEGDKGKKKGKTAKFERLRITGKKTFLCLRTKLRLAFHLMAQKMGLLI